MGGGKVSGWMMNFFGRERIDINVGFFFGRGSNGDEEDGVRAKCRSIDCSSVLGWSEKWL